MPVQIQHAPPFIGRPETQLHSESSEAHRRGEQSQVGAGGAGAEPWRVIQASDVGFSDRDTVHIHRLGLHDVGV